MVNIFNEKGSGQVEIHVLSALDEFGITSCQVENGKERVAKMKEEKWAFVAYRLDYHEISKPLQFVSFLLRGYSNAAFSGSSITANRWLEVGQVW